ncbi:hypothetical protein HK099_005514 [Clydaea vesicula]|uniref:Uncharacterized protein n=1 Tax=Clydaea vesicula TaxID=447962 RepID=A0AAD5U2D2_9FUNG|nr:hypothetical protein HK099_005514 [Clydaea vesicula]
MFELETKRSFPIPSHSIDISTYKLQNSQFRVVIVPIPGPLVSLDVIIPTLVEDHKGLPHTLEHLIFCGSKTFKERGYLDYLATRSLSAGTNAYTAEDHTAYQLTTAGEEGMVNVLPVFMDHVLSPTLNDSQFITEVFHMDKEAKHQGVVFCEMSSRENTEPDMLDLALKRLLFQNSTTYSFEAGGLTKDIAHLTNEEILHYHKEFYHLDNTTLLICGEVNPENIFEALNSVEGLLDATCPNKGSPQKMIVAPKLPDIPQKLISRTIHFPSTDEEVGSISYGWRGPYTKDLKDVVALEVLFRYLSDTAASPLNQKFVEIDSPMASSCDFDLKYYVESGLCLYFSGVPYRSEGSDEDDSDSGEVSDAEESETSWVSDDDGMEVDKEKITGEENENDVSDDLDDGHFFENDRYYKLLMEVLSDVAESFTVENISTLNLIHSSIKRLKRKLLEGLEENPHEMINSIIVADIVRYHCADPLAGGKHAKSSGGLPLFGIWSDVFTVLDELLKQPIDYWKDLLDIWLLQTTVTEVKMIPDKKLAKSITEAEENAIKSRCTRYGAESLARIGIEVDKAIKENEVNLSKDILNSMPNVPDIAKVSKLNSSSFLTLNTDNSKVRNLQFVFTETSFSQVRFFFNCDGLDEHLCSYLVLFQELLFQTAIFEDDNKSLMDYKTLVNLTSDLLINNEAAVGLGNSLWGCSWLSEIFMLGGTCENDDWEKMLQLLLKVLFRSVFLEERVITITKNLISEITELKRSGTELLSQISTRISHFNDKKGNDLVISIFKQEKFLQNILTLIKEKKFEIVCNDLKKLQKFFIKNLVKEEVEESFCQISFPLKYKDNLKNNTFTTSLNKMWNEETELFNLRNKSEKSDHQQQVLKGKSPFPFPRQVFHPDLTDKKFGNNILCGVAGLQNSFMFQTIRCDAFESDNPVDSFAVKILGELLSITEGPLYTGVRGKGLAYGIYCSFSVWYGQLTISIDRSSDPRKALLVFYETARASFAFALCNSKSTSNGLVGSILRSLLRGYKSFEEEEEKQKLLYKVSKDDLKRVYQKYFRKFLDPKERISVLTTVTGEPLESLKKAFNTYPAPNELPYCGKAKSNLNLRNYLIDYRTVQLEDLML